MKVVIIGNGFDLAHGIESSYSNFENFLKENHSKFYEEFANYTSFKSTSPDYWYQFEKELESFDEKAVRFFAEYQVEKFSQWDGWDDKIERDVADSLFDKFKTLKEKFAEWVGEIDLSPASSNKKESFEIVIKEDPLILSFNYTRTIEDYYDFENVYHIHGEDNYYCIDSDHIILGHNKVSMEHVENRMNEPEYRNDAFYRFQCKYHGYFCKNSEEVIKESDFFEKLKETENIDSIHIFGHSIETVDQIYFKEIFDIIGSSVTWYVSYYREEDKQLLTNNIKKISPNIKVEFFKI